MKCFMLIHKPLLLVQYSKIMWKKPCYFPALSDSAYSEVYSEEPLCLMTICIPGEVLVVSGFVVAFAPNTWFPNKEINDSKYEIPQI